MNSERNRGISFDSIIIEPMKDEHIDPSIELWVSQYKIVKKSFQALPGKWNTDLTSIQFFLEEHIKNGNGIVAKTKGKIIGYMVYNTFPFHGANIIYCSILGHASVDSGRTIIYQKMYKFLSDKWVKNNVLDHIITFFSHDVQLTNTLFNLDFGLYAVDSYRSVDPIYPEESAVILKASLCDVEDIMRLGEESRSYYREAPLFFVRNKEKRECAREPSACGSIKSLQEKTTKSPQFRAILRALARAVGTGLGLVSVEPENPDDITRGGSATEISLFDHILLYI